MLENMPIQGRTQCCKIGGGDFSVFITHKNAVPGPIIQSLLSQQALNLFNENDKAYYDYIVVQNSKTLL